MALFVSTYNSVFGARVLEAMGVEYVVVGVEVGIKLNQNHGQTQTPQTETNKPHPGP